MNQGSYSGHSGSDQWNNSLPSAGTFLWPDDWTVAMPSEDFIISASSTVPQPTSANIPAPQGLTTSLAAHSTGTEEPKAIRTQLKERVDGANLQISPTRESFSEIQNTIPSVAVPAPPAPPDQVVDDGGATANDENAPAGPGASVPLPTLVYENAPIVGGATQPTQNFQPNATALLNRLLDANVQEMPQPEALRQFSGTPLPTFSNDDLEAILNFCLANTNDILARDTAIPAAQETLYDSAPCFTESISRKRKLDEIVEGNNMESHGAFEFSITAEPSEVGELSECVGFAGGSEFPEEVVSFGDGEPSGDTGVSGSLGSPLKAESLGRVGPSEVVGSSGTESFRSAEPIEAAGSSGNAEGVCTEPSDVVEHPEVVEPSGDAGVSKGAGNMRDWYCDYCELGFTKKNSSSHYRTARCRDNQLKYAFIHGAIPKWYATKLCGHHRSKARPFKRPAGEEKECDECGEACEERRKIWESYVETYPKKKVSKILEELAEHHAPLAKVETLDFSKYGSGLDLVAHMLPPMEPTSMPGPRPKKARRIAKKSTAVDPQMGTPQLPHGPPAPRAPAQQVWYAPYTHAMPVPYASAAVTGMSAYGVPLGAPYPVDPRSYALANALTSFGYSCSPGVQSHNQGSRGFGSIEGPSSRAWPAVPPTNATPYGIPGHYLQHPQQPVVYTMPMGQINHSFHPIPAAPTMGNAYYGAHNYNATAPMMAVPIFPARGPAMENIYYHAGAAPMMYEPALPRR